MFAFSKKFKTSGSTRFSKYSRCSWYLSLGLIRIVYHCKKITFSLELSNCFSIFQFFISIISSFFFLSLHCSCSNKGTHMSQKRILNVNLPSLPKCTEFFNRFSKITICFKFRLKRFLRRGHLNFSLTGFLKTRFLVTGFYCIDLVLLLNMSIITPPDLIFTMASSLNDMKKKNKGIQGMEWRNSIFKTTD